jgi:hypothetical protein
MTRVRRWQTSWTIVVLLALVLATLGCRRPDAGSVELREARYRWVGEGGSHQPIRLEGQEPPGRGRADSLELCFDAPALDVDDPALLTQDTDALVGARAAGREVRLRRDSGLVPLASPPVAQQVCLTYRAWYQLRVFPAVVGSQRDVTAAAARRDGIHFAIGFVLAVVGAVLVAASLRRQSGRAYRWIGVFAMTMGIVAFAQSAHLRGLLFESPPLWRWVRGVGLCLEPVGLVLFVRELFGDTPRRWLIRLTWMLLAATACAAAADLLQLAPILSTRRVVYAFIAAMLAAGTSVLWKRIRAGDRAARLFLVGLAAMMVVAAPDILIGLRVLPGPSAGFSNIGVLVLVVALGAVVESRYREQRASLEDKTEQLSHQVHELERRRAHIERLAEELRHQLERRSRELRIALASSDHRAEGRMDPSVAQYTPDDVVDERYRIEDRLGAGAMGVVYRVARITDGRHFALKVMTGMASPRDAARFAREAEIAAKLLHPNLVALVDVGIARGSSVYLVMELVRGGSLEDARSRFGDEAWGFPLLVDVALGLQALHRAGIVHRDLKPANVLLEAREGERPIARLADFGVARADVGMIADRTLSHREAEQLGEAATARLEPALTAAGALVGTPRYMPPEAARGGTSLAADVFALGIVAHEVLTGLYPFQMPPVLAALAGRGEAATMDASMRPALRDLVAKMLDADPARRPSTDDVVEALGAAAASDQPDPGPEQPRDAGMTGKAPTPAA